jgi:hypothetical protein
MTEICRMIFSASRMMSGSVLQVAFAESSYQDLRDEQMDLVETA